MNLCSAIRASQEKRRNICKKNKYDLAQEVASFLYDSETFETCERCFMNRECWKNMDDDMEDPEKSLCASSDILRKAIERKYNL